MSHFPQLNSIGNIEEDELILESKIYKSQYNYDYIEISIIKNKSKVVLNILYYEIKIIPRDFTRIIKKKYNSIDEFYDGINQIFEQNKYIIMDISNQVMKIKLIVEDNEINMKREILLNLKSIFGNASYFIQKLEKEVKEIQEENYQLKKDNIRLKKDVELLKKRIYGTFKCKLNILFDDPIQKINIVCNNNDSISTLINEYKLKTGKLYLNCDFLFNNQKLDCDMLVEEAGLSDMSTIYLMKKEENYYKIGDCIIFIRFGITNSLPIIMISLIKNEKVSNLIQRYRIESNDLRKNIEFTFNAKNLNNNLTIEEAGLSPNSKIFVFEFFPEINFKFYNIKEEYFPICIPMNKDFSVSKLIKDFLLEISFDGEGFKLMLNSKELTEDLQIKELDLKKYLEMVVVTEKPVKIISLIFKYFIDENEKTININAIKNYYISALIKIIDKKFEIKAKKLIFKNKELEKYLTIEEAGLNNNDIIYIKNNEE